MKSRIKNLLSRNFSTNTPVVLEKLDALHGFHWVVVLGSLFLTFGAWYISKTQVEEKNKIRFEREADQIKNLVLERMQKYEDALWAGVGYIRASGGDINFNNWSYYADAIHIEEKYPGINGMGVIHSISKARLSTYLTKQRKLRPNYKIYPKHEENEYLPISYIIPVKGNQKAVGLDMAHETNRFVSAKKAIDTGEARITGPITLVQDKEKTPGFLFYAPFYRGGTYTNIRERREKIVGMVYAPFIVKKLMNGVLAKQSRHINIKISDQNFVLYNEHNFNSIDFDPKPLFQETSKIPLYGRTWDFEIWSAKSFRQASSIK